MGTKEMMSLYIVVVTVVFLRLYCTGCPVLGELWQGPPEGGAGVCQAARERQRSDPLPGRLLHGPPASQRPDVHHEALRRYETPVNQTKRAIGS